MGAKMSGSGGSRYETDQNADINVTPFVDVMLVLLIIFMVAAPMAAVTVEVTLPPAVAKPGVNPPKPVYISLQTNGRLFIQDNETDLPSLGDDLRRSLGEKRNPTRERIFIRADRDVEYGDFMGVMNMLQDNGFYSVALVGEDRNT
ncbi:ExbD/TolR family protein [Phenylobacterium deserti]|uniref:Biopolymer transporter ExbD n=1 Tax=Phenylobacterium deserti TaxID=1914756 RepID=A0A328AD94_9CAUL|nr:biopolymer transporter ExbD [Phenylobacterium deserti]RAK52610.1 biopolymer transporter ExbD [Phenylobacterium deserti]